MITAKTAKQRILALLNAETDLTGVRIMFAQPTREAQTADEEIFLGRVEGTSEWGALGNRRRNESYTIDLVIRVIKPGDQEQATEERCWDLAAIVDRVLRADPRLGGLLNPSAQPTAFTMQSAPLNDQHYWSVFTGQVACEAQTES